MTDRAELLLGLSLGFLAQRRGLRVATAESCTGGQAAALLTALPGSSAWFEGGVVSYGNGVKSALLRVPEELLQAQGAVSTPVALAMAEGLAANLSTWPGELACVAFTGVAGPGGGTPQKPVGLVCFAWGRPGLHWVGQRCFSGDRAAVQAQAVWFGLSTLAGLLLTADGSGGSVG